MFQYHENALLLSALKNDCYVCKLCHFERWQFKEIIFYKDIQEWNVQLGLCSYGLTNKKKKDPKIMNILMPYNW